MNKFYIKFQDYGDEDKIIPIYEVWDKNLNIIVSEHTTEELAREWIKQNGAEIENSNLMLEVL